ncbi:MAG: hypothetical protein QNK16_01955 [Woeseiaceae bacterium]|nr:hypothetical protein [Woeseiaceae bacterium]MDX2607120.1 hypothetical protein [Woeseiaceae bacterium]
MTVSLPKVLLLIAVSAVATGCAATSTTSASPGLAKVSYSNFLVIGVAGNYTNRAYFERSVVSGIRAKGSSASAFHVVAGGNKPVTSETVGDAIESGGFDAVLVSRVIDTDTDLDVKSAVTGTKVTRKDGGVLDLFRYDYEELDEPLSLELKTKVNIATELYSAASEQKVWSIESVSSATENIGQLIEDAAENVVKRLHRDDLISRE